MGGRAYEGWTALTRREREGKRGPRMYKPILLTRVNSKIMGKRGELGQQGIGGKMSDEKENRVGEGSSMVSKVEDLGHRSGGFESQQDLRQQAESTKRNLGGKT